MALRHFVRRAHRVASFPPSSRLFCTSTPTSTVDESVFVNPTHPSDAYDIVNSKRKPCIPALGFGTWGNEYYSHEAMAASVDTALSLGYRHIDCGRVWGNEKLIGEVISDHLNKGTLKRSELFVSSKLFNNEHAPPDGAPLRALETTLKHLQLDYVDSFQIHWPFRNSIHLPPVAFSAETWFFTLKLLHELELQGLTRSVGVCNVSIAKFEALLGLCAKYGLPKPGTLQVECHPYLQQAKVMRMAEDNDMIVSTAMPLGSPQRPQRHRREGDVEVLADAVLAEVSAEVGRSVAQCVIRWHLQMGRVCIPKAEKEWQIAENLQCLEFTLNSEQMARINALDRGYRFMRAEYMRWIEHQTWQEMWDFEDPDSQRKIVENGGQPLERAAMPAPAIQM